MPDVAAVEALTRDAIQSICNHRYPPGLSGAVAIRRAASLEPEELRCASLRGRHALGIHLAGGICCRANPADA